jgi:hypothetical protein
MNVQLAATAPLWRAERRIRLPERLPPFKTTAYCLFTVIWIATLVLAIAGPILGL